MTFAEAKDRVAKKYEFASWTKMRGALWSNDQDVELDRREQEAADIYASEARNDGYKEGWIDCENNGTPDRSDSKRSHVTCYSPNSSD